MSEEKCFCHIKDKNGNTYVVKDKEARTKLEQIENILYRLTYQAPSVSVNLSRSTGKQGNSYDITVTATVTKGTENIVSVKVNNIDMTASSTGKTYTYKFTSVSVNTTYTVNVDDSVEGAEASKSITFVYPFYHGTGAFNPASPQGEDISARSNKSYSFTMNDDICHIAYPKAHGALSSIYEGIYDYTDNFMQTTATVNGQEYYVYTKIDKCSDTFTFKFNFN